MRSEPWIALASIALISIFGSMTAVRAATCDDQKGKLIFEDTFADDSGGWETDSDVKIGGGAFVLRLNPGDRASRDLNDAFNASDADYCLEVVVPRSVAADDLVEVGLIFWATDYQNYFLFRIVSDGRAQLLRITAEKWGFLADITDPSMKLDVGSVAAIRVRAAGNLIALSVNGVDLKKLRVQTPSGALRFGIDASTDVETPAPGIDFTVKRFRVTDGK
jgi:hypothetical protein